MKISYATNEKMLQTYGVMFENLSKELEVKKYLEEFGYNDEKIAQGKALYDDARREFDLTKKSVSEQEVKFVAFDEAYKAFYNTFVLHRKKARVALEENEAALIKTGLRTKFPRSFASAVENIRSFYAAIKEDAHLLQLLNGFKIKREDIDQQIEKLSEVEKLYASYVEEKGKSQQATQTKNEAFSLLDKWVKKFFRVAKIALGEKVQLLESIGKVVKY